MTGALVEYGFASTASEEAEATAFYRKTFSPSTRVVDLLEWRRNAQPTARNASFLARSGGEVVGAMNLVPVDLRVGDRAVKAAWQQDSVVSPELRGRGIGRELINRSATAFEVLLAKGTSDAMYQLRKSCGFRDVVNSNYLVRVLSPARFGTGVKRRIYGVALAAMSLSQRRPQRTSRATRPLDGFGADFDRLARAARPTPEIAPVKDSAYLNWRYLQCPGREYRVIGSTSAEGDTGAAIIRHGSTAWLVDVVCDHSDIDSLVALIRASVADCRAAGAASVNTFATSGRARAALRREGFVEVSRTPRFTYRWTAQRGPFDGADLSSLDWTFWHGDGDIEFYV